jgi:hypothetical protein
MKQPPNTTSARSFKRRMMRANPSTCDRPEGLDRPFCNRLAEWVPAQSRRTGAPRHRRTNGNATATIDLRTKRSLRAPTCKLSCSLAPRPGLEPGTYGLTGWASIGPLARMNARFSGFAFPILLGRFAQRTHRMCPNRPLDIGSVIADFSAELFARRGPWWGLSRERVVFGPRHSRRAFADYGR